MAHENTVFRMWVFDRGVYFLSVWIFFSIVARYSWSPVLFTAVVALVNSFSAVRCSLHAMHTIALLSSAGERRWWSGP